MQGLTQKLISNDYINCSLVVTVKAHSYTIFTENKGEFRFVIPVAKLESKVCCKFYSRRDAVLPVFRVVTAILWPYWRTASS